MVPPTSGPCRADEDVDADEVEGLPALQYTPADHVPVPAEPTGITSVLTGRRKAIILGSILLMAFGYFAFTAFQNATSYYYSVDEFIDQGPVVGENVRVKGTLVPYSFERESQRSMVAHFVFEDGVYYTTGGQPIPGAGKINLAGIAKEAGFRESHEFDNLEDLASELPNIMKAKGPIFVCLKVTHGDELPDVNVGTTGDAMRRTQAKLLEG